MLKKIVTSSSREQGFSLAEVMIVIVIMGLIVLLSIPSYMQYVSRAQVSEAFALTAAIKMPVIEWIMENESLPDSISSVAGITSGKYVASISVEGSVDEPRIIARMKLQGTTGNIRDKLFILSTSNQGKTWSCRLSTISSNHLPSVCAE